MDRLRLQILLNCGLRLRMWNGIDCSRAMLLQEDGRSSLMRLPVTPRARVPLWHALRTSADHRKDKCGRGAQHGALDTYCSLRNAQPRARIADGTSRCGQFEKRKQSERRRSFFRRRITRQRSDQNVSTSPSLSSISASSASSSFSSRRASFSAASSMSSSSSPSNSSSSLST